MDFKPGDFLVGLIDFFAVLLPGAILAFAFKQQAMTRVFNGSVFPALSGDTAQWTVFIIGSYLLGHFVFWAGALLDDTVYDWYREKGLNRRGDHAFKEAEKIKYRQVGDSREEEVINPFQWAKATVHLLYPSAAGEIHRFEANSKFFRSMIVVLTLICVKLIYYGAWVEFFLFLGLTLASFLIYASLRNKGGKVAYNYLITLDRMGKLQKGE
jgi:hypothetical protein